MGVRTCFSGKMSHSACVFIHGGIGRNMVEMILTAKHFLEVSILYCFLRSMFMKKKRITFGLLGLMYALYCLLCIVRYTIKTISLSELLPSPPKKTASFLSTPILS
ncbi:hypothetical protein BN2127_JRS1_07814 [Bacillus cereus]|nr:hypothetical protein BN2127_JRS1_07814 [Bacillus cereus]